MLAELGRFGFYYLLNLFRKLVDLARTIYNIPTAIYSSLEIATYYFGFTYYFLAVCQFGANLTLVEALQAQLIDKYDDAMIDGYNMSYLLMGKERRQKSPQFVMYRASNPSLGDPLSTQVACGVCKRIRQDRAPYWMKSDGRYVVTTSSCRQCPRKKNQIVKTIHYPVSKSVKTISKENVVKKYWAAYPDAPGADKYREKQRERRLSGIARRKRTHKKKKGAKSIGRR